MDIRILYEDENLIVCVKPVGILSQPSENEKESMVSVLEEKYAYCGLVHRLDRNVGGVMLFSKKKSMTDKLSALVAQRDFSKEYMAVLRGETDSDEGVLRDLLFKDSRRNKTFVVNRMRKGVREAELSYRTLDKKDGLSLVRVKLHTGRTHQVRVQFASRRLPLVGDGKYGGSDNNASIALWSYRVSFCHPLRGETVDVCCPPPDTYPWNIFDTVQLI